MARVCGIHPMKIQKPICSECPGVWSMFIYPSKVRNEMVHIAPCITQMGHIIYVGLFVFVVILCLGGWSDLSAMYLTQQLF